MIISRNELVIRELEMTEHYLDRLARTINENWDQPALTDFYLTEDGNSQDTSRGNHYTYGEMYAELCHVAELLTSLGLQKGDHVVICGANSAHWIIAYLAIAKMQGVSVTVMHSLQPDQIAQMINFSDAKALIVDKDIWEDLKEQSLPLIQSVIALESWNLLFGEIQIINHKPTIINGECGFPHSEPDSLAMICFTSGTTGNPKGVMLSYGCVSVNALYLSQLYKSIPKKNAISFIPFSHMGGFILELIQPLCDGEDVNITQQPISLKELNRCYTILSPTIVMMVPGVLYKMLELYPKEQINSLLGSNLYLLGIGGAKLSHDIENRMISEGIPLAIGYGTTECGPFISIAMPHDFKSGAAGRLISSISCKISPVGEILVKGENVMLGYYKDPEATAAKIDSDGWLHTGDKGHLDEDGYLYVEGRLEQDIIVLPNGENIRPDNIEALINALPEVSESIVLARDGKLVARVVVPSSLPFREESEVGSLRRMILRQVNPQLPLFSQLYDVEITDQPLARTEKQTLKRYLYK